MMTGADSSSDDIQWMRRAVRVAMNGRGGVEPNPMVGCVIARENRVIGEGYHQQFGGPHAEPMALHACGQNPEGATAYVTLEPCCHVDKKTPPCVPLLIAAKLARVVVACRDPNPKVSGRGIEQLRAAGISVTEGVCQAEAQQLNAAFFKRIEHHRPYVTLKWAETADGKVAGPGGRRMQIGNASSNAAVHRLRSVCDGILVGINTVLNDDPRLTTRNFDPQRTTRRLHRMVLDSNLRIPTSSRLVQSARQSPVIVFCSAKTFAEKPNAIATLEAEGVEVVSLRCEAAGRISLSHLLQILGERMLTHVIVEPGPTLAASFLGRNLADRVWIFRSPKMVDDASAPAAVKVSYPVAAELALSIIPSPGTPEEEVKAAKVENASTEQMRAPLEKSVEAIDRLTEYLNPRGDAFYALTPSADFTLLSPRGRF